MIEKAAVLLSTEQHGTAVPLLEASVAPLSLVATHSRIHSSSSANGKHPSRKGREWSQARAGNHAAGSSVLAAELSVTLQCDVFSMEKMGWEPVLDPWTVSAAWALAPQPNTGAADHSCLPQCQHLMVKAGQVMDLTATSSLFAALAQAEKLAMRLRLERAAFIVSRHADVATAAAVAGASVDMSGMLADADVFPSTAVPARQAHVAPAFSLAAPFDTREHGAFGSAVSTAKSIAVPGSATFPATALDTRRSTGLLHLNLKGAPGHGSGPLRPSASYGAQLQGFDLSRHPSPDSNLPAAGLAKVAGSLAEDRDNNALRASQEAQHDLAQAGLPAAAVWFYNDLGAPLEVCVSDRWVGGAYHMLAEIACFYEPA
jgi:hypothetical protein